MTLPMFIDGDEVRRRLPMAAAIDLMAETLRAFSAGRAVQPPRSFFRTPGGEGLVGLMPAFVPDPDVVGVKVISAFHGADPAHDGAVLLFDMEGRLVGVVDAIAVTEIRTAAVSGVATRLLAREDAGDLAILGSGVQARSHLEAMREVRELRRVRVWSRRRSRAAAFAAWTREAHGVDVEPVDPAEEAARDADLLCPVTSSPESVLLGDWVSAGAHVNAVGSFAPTTRELDTALVARSSFYVDSRQSVELQAGAGLLATEEAGLDPGHIRGELGEVVAGEAGRSSREEVTVFKSLGLGVEDAAAGRAVVGAND
ncbi:MAG TPA: ornithine cyclodeaminase family protein [Candidatus Limnocylindrales bacterium]|nr:ornithine cyclodeaminase family protein [Candidatus Limnocylindrales bacterium]